MLKNRGLKTLLLEQKIIQLISGHDVPHSYLNPAEDLGVLKRYFKSGKCCIRALNQKWLSKLA